MTPIIKLLRADEWAQFQETRVFAGSADDLRDGYIHISTPEQAPGTLAKWFAGDTGDRTLIRCEDYGTVNVTTGQPGRSAVAQGASAIDEHNKGHFPHRLTLSDARQV
jgi:hypothetical protein